MNAVEYLKIKGRMTKNCTINCTKCPFDDSNSSKHIDCMEFESKYPEQAVEIVEKWAKENPVKTYKSVLLEKFPNASLSENGVPRGCPRNLFNIDNGQCPATTCVKCWNREYKEETNEI